MVNNRVLQGCVVGTAKQNVTLREFLKERARRQLWRRFVSIDDSKPLGADASLPCVQSTLSFS